MRLNSAPYYGPQRHNEQTRRMGSWMRWWRGRRCSCGSQGDPGRAILTCLVCGGTGVRYTATPTLLQGLLTGAESEIKLFTQGIALPGDFLFSLDPQAPLLDNQDLMRLDRRDFPEGEPFLGETIQRGTGTLVDRLFIEPATVAEVVQDNPATGTTRTYISPTEYTVNGETLVWTAAAGTKPVNGTFYSVQYRGYFTYMVFAPPTLRAERGQSFGQRVLLRRLEHQLPKTLA